jgi:hypothetical protein
VKPTYWRCVVCVTRRSTLSPVLVRGDRRGSSNSVGLIRPASLWPDVFDSKLVALQRGWIFSIPSCLG